MQNSSGYRADPQYILHLMVTCVFGLNLTSSVFCHIPIEFLMKALEVMLMSKAFQHPCVSHWVICFWAVHWLVSLVLQSWVTTQDYQGLGPSGVSAGSFLSPAFAKFLYLIMNAICKLLQWTMKQTVTTIPLQFLQKRSFWFQSVSVLTICSPDG